MISNDVQEWSDIAYEMWALLCNSTTDGHSSEADWNAGHARRPLPRSAQHPAAIHPKGQRSMSDVFCLASNDEDFPTLAECTRRNGHDQHHCDTRKRLSWDGNGEVDCPAGHDHGKPDQRNRADRRGNTIHPRSAGSRADYRPGFARRGGK